MTDGDFFKLGWQRFAHDPDVARWAELVRPVASETIDSPAHAHWMRCGGTWFAGVNALPNDDTGAVPDRNVPSLAGSVFEFIHRTLDLDGFAWDRAQVSVCFPGYPRPWDGETEAAFGYRKNRDAAHVDGLRRIGGSRRRALGEVHGFILGLPLTDAGAEASPLVVFEGSHEIMRAAFRERLAGIAPDAWSNEDMTDAYVDARRKCFESCPRVTVHARPGEAYLIHRLALHGVAPWIDGEGARMIAYFRPDPYPGSTPEWWLQLP